MSLFLISNHWVHVFLSWSVFSLICLELTNETFARVTWNSCGWKNWSETRKKKWGHSCGVLEEKHRLNMSGKITLQTERFCIITTQLQFVAFSSVHCIHVCCFVWWCFFFLFVFIMYIGKYLKLAIFILQWYSSHMSSSNETHLKIV